MNTSKTLRATNWWIFTVQVKRVHCLRTISSVRGHMNAYIFTNLVLILFTRRVQQTLYTIMFIMKIFNDCHKKKKKCEHILTVSKHAWIRKTHPGFKWPWSFYSIYKKYTMLRRNKLFALFLIATIKWFSMRVSSKGLTCSCRKIQEIIKRKFS